MAFKLRSGNKTSFKEMGSAKPKKEGFMHPPYKKPVGPVERPHVHGYKDVKPKKSTETAHGQLNDAQAEYETDKKLLKKSPAKGLREDEQVVDGQLCDAYGNPKPSKEDMKKMTQAPNFSNSARKGKQEKGLGPGFNDKKKKEAIKQEARQNSGKKTEEDKAAAKKLKKEKDMNTMNESIDMALGKS